MDYTYFLPVSGIGNAAIHIENDPRYDTSNFGQGGLREASITVLDDMDNDLRNFETLVSLDATAGQGIPQIPPNSLQNAFRNIRPIVKRSADSQRNNDLPQPEKKKFCRCCIN